MDGFNRVVLDTPRGSISASKPGQATAVMQTLANGIIVYTVEGISWTVLAIAAAISFHRDRTSPRSAGPPIYVTASH